MDKSIIQFGYCPVQDTTYFVNIGYKLKEINYYVKVKSECSYVSYYHNASPIAFFAVSGNFSINSFSSITLVSDFTPPAP